jgi:hypothetical protein
MEGFNSKKEMLSKQKSVRLLKVGMASIENLDKHSTVRLLFGVLVVLGALYVTAYTYVESNMLKGFPRTNILSMTEQKSPKPYIYRTLVPLSINSIASLTPEYLSQAAGSKVIAIVQSEEWKRRVRPIKAKGFLPLPDNPKLVYKILVNFLVQTGFLIAYAYGISRLSVHFYYSPLLGYLTGLFGIFILLACISPPNKIYDFPVLAFFTWCLVALYRHQWALYLFLFALTTLNKETSIFLTVLSIFLYWDLIPKKQLLGFLLAQLFLYFGITESIKWYYLNWPGQMRYFRGWSSITFSLNKFSVQFVLLISFIAYLCLARWKEIPLALKRSLILVPACIAVYAFYGLYREYRVFYECLPVLTVIAAYTIFAPLKTAS